MRVLFLFPYPPGSAPSQRFRFEQYLPYLREQGLRIDTQSFWSQAAWRILYQRGHTVRKGLFFLSGCLRRLWMALFVWRYEFVFIHREAAPIGPPVLEWFIARVTGRKIIYDFDDAIWMANTSKENRIVSKLKWHGKVGAICRWSYRVTCGNAFLAAYAKNYSASVHVIPTSIDTEHVHNPEHFSAVEVERNTSVGWTGTHSTLPYLDTIVPIFRALSKKNPGISFIVIADRPPKWTLTNLRFHPWQADSEIADLMQISLGVMPLPDEPWAKGKCGLKALQFMSLGIPVLVSPVGVNTELVAHGGTGYWCRTPEEWEMYLTYLIEHPEEAKRMGRLGRQQVIERYSVDALAPSYRALFA